MARFWIFFGDWGGHENIRTTFGSSCTFHFCWGSFKRVVSLICWLSIRGKPRLMLELKKRRRRGAKNRVDITRDNFRPLSHFWNIFSPEFLEDLFPHSDPWSFMNFDILKNPYEVEITSILFSVFPKFSMSSHPGPSAKCQVHKDFVTSESLNSCPAGMLACFQNQLGSLFALLLPLTLMNCCLGSTLVLQADTYFFQTFFALDNLFYGTWFWTDRFQSDLLNFPCWIKLSVLILCTHFIVILTLFVFVLYFQVTWTQNVLSVVTLTYTHKFPLLGQ